MDSSRARSLGLVAALCTACTSHSLERDHGERACPGADLDPGLLWRIQGTWTVRHADYLRGAKPLGLEQVGALTVAGCRYTFSADEGAKLRELRRWFPMVDRPTGFVEIVGVAPPSPDAFLDIDLGVIRLHGDPPDRPLEGVEEASDSIELGVLERLQEGEFLEMRATDDTLPGHTLSIERGEATRRFTGWPRSFAPDLSNVDVDAIQRDADDTHAALPRWREEVRARAAAATRAAAARAERPSTRGGGPSP
ncbi:MAG: hypothetical protein R3B09_20490 [Nannocystaceae bacterium]